MCNTADPGSPWWSTSYCGSNTPRLLSLRKEKIISNVSNNLDPRISPETRTLALDNYKHIKIIFVYNYKTCFSFIVEIILILQRPNNRYSMYLFKKFSN